MYKILIVEDESSMQIGLKDNLEIEGYETDTTGNGREAINKIINNKYDLVLLDVMLPEVSGFEICKNIRNKGIVTPIIFLTAKGEEIDKVIGLEIGADDYIVKPFSLRELLARIKVRLRSTDKQETAPVSKDIEIGNLRVNFENYEAFCNGSPEKLTVKEFEILSYLLKRDGRIVSREDLLDNVWGMEYQPTSRTIDNFILKLRQKIEKNCEDPKHIITVHGVGYKLIK